MKIASIDLFYFRLPEIRDIADGSQDSFIVRVRSDTGLEGFGESDSSPLVAMSCFITPTSHSNIVNLSQSLIGQTLDEPEDVRRIYRHAKRRAMDIAHFPHAYAAADIALWDLLGKHLTQPVYRLLGHAAQHPKRAYASHLFQETPEATAQLAARSCERGFTAAKFGWGPMGHHGEAFDIELVRAARAGLGGSQKGAALMVDAGTIWQRDHETALARARAFAPFDVTWLEEPLNSEAVDEYAALSAASPIPIAAGEGCNTVREAQDLAQNGGLRYLQIDPGRIGGITPSFDVLQFAKRRGRTFVNHTYKSHISLSAALSVFAGEAEHSWLEYCQSDSPLIKALVREPLMLDKAGYVSLHERPGLGIDVDLPAVREFARHVCVSIDRRTIGESSTLT
jgi:L-alanine-DL-glutamate epimerase-like enolase superfamily enzyme